MVNTDSTAPIFLSKVKTCEEIGTNADIMMYCTLHVRLVAQDLSERENYLKIIGEESWDLINNLPSELDSGTNNARIITNIITK